MENQTPLDYLPTEEPRKPERRTRYLIVESLLYVVLLLSLLAFSMGMQAYAVIVALLCVVGLIIFNFAIPIIKLIRKEIGLGLFILYLLRTIIIIFILLGAIFKFESMPYARELFIIGFLSIWPFFLLIPNIEIRKYKAGILPHLLVTIMGIGLTLGYIGMLFKIEAWPYSELNAFQTFSMLLCVPVFLVLLIYIWRSKEHFYLKYYLPQLVLMCYFNINYLIA